MANVSLRTLWLGFLYSLPISPLLVSGNDPLLQMVTGNKDDLVWTEAPDSLIPLLEDKQRYNKHVAPGQVLGQTTTVNVAIYIESMSSFKAQTMDFEMDMYLAMSWIDQRLMHNRKFPILITDPEISALLWIPDLYFVNSKAASLRTVTTPNFMMLVYPDGLVFKSLGVDVTLSCVMNFENYPLDEQECPIYMQSFAYVQSVVNLSWFEDAEKNFPINHNPELSLNDMVVKDKTHTYCSSTYEMLRGRGFWSCLEGRVRMKRYILFHIFQTYVPTAMLVSISWLSFWLDPKASPARISLTITTLLTLTTMSNGAKQGLPQVNYVKAIDIWLSMCTGFVFCVLLEYTLVCFYVGRKRTRCQQHPPEISTYSMNGKRTVEVSRACSICAILYEKNARRIDRISRAVFPLSFTICALAYWSFYLIAYLDNSVRRS